MRATPARLVGGPSDGETISWNGFERWYVPVVPAWDGIIKPGALCYARAQKAEYRLKTDGYGRGYFEFAGMVAEGSLEE